MACWSLRCRARCCCTASISIRRFRTQQNGCLRRSTRGTVTFFTPRQVARVTTDFAVSACLHGRWARARPFSCVTWGYCQLKLHMALDAQCAFSAHGRSILPRLSMINAACVPHGSSGSRACSAPASTGISDSRPRGLWCSWPPAPRPMRSAARAYGSRLGARRVNWAVCC